MPRPALTWLVDLAAFFSNFHMFVSSSDAEASELSSNLHSPLQMKGWFPLISVRRSIRRIKIQKER